MINPGVFAQLKKSTILKAIIKTGVVFYEVTKT